MSVTMTDDEFDSAAEEALASIPEALQEKIENVVVFVEDAYEPQPWEDPHTVLLGLYEGIPITERGGEPWAMPDRITLYKDPILELCDSREEVIHQVRITVIHEVAHFFGFDDDTLTQLGWG